jgi:hypothetical protein
MADLKITEMEAVSTPVDADILEMVQNVSTTPVNKKITWLKIKQFLTIFLNTQFSRFSIIQGQGMMASPADSTTYYVGHPGWSVTTSKSFSQIQFSADAGYLNRIHVRFERGGTTATDENSSVYLLINTTEYLLSDTVKLGYTQFINLDIDYLAIALEYGDVINLKIVTPAWATNPTNVNVTFEAYIYPYAETE